VHAGRSYTGEWKNDVKHGTGTMRYPDGSEYVGDFRDDRRHGQGVFTTAGVATKAKWFLDKAA